MKKCWLFTRVSFFYHLSCPYSQHALEKVQTRHTSPQEVVRNHCFHGNGKQRWGHYQFRGIDSRSLVIFNLRRWIGHQACRGIEKATTFAELRLMSLSFGDWPNYSLLANYSPLAHLSGCWNWVLAHRLCLPSTTSIYFTLRKEGHSLASSFKFKMNRNQL